MSLSRRCKNAAAATGSDFHYLLGTAMRESSLKAECAIQHLLGRRAVPVRRPDLAGTGQGAWRQIWPGRAGRRHHTRPPTAAITPPPTPTARQSWRCKKDPQVSALMAGEYARTTQSAMQANLGRPVCGGELYAAHFLGAGRRLQADPAGSAASPAPAPRRRFPAGRQRQRNRLLSCRRHAPRTCAKFMTGRCGSREATGWLPIRAAAGAAPPAAKAVAARAADTNIETLLAGVMNWQPTRLLRRSANGAAVLCLGTAGSVLAARGKF